VGESVRTHGDDWRANSLRGEFSGVNILALETTESIGSVAALVGDNLLREKSLDPEKRTARSLAPGIQTLLEEVGWKPGEVQLVAVTVGPGSFTGVRVGVATAKTFAYCVGAQVLGVSTLDAIVAGAPPDILAVEAAVDAQRGDVVAGAYHRDRDGWFRPTQPPALLGMDKWLGGLAPGSVVTGPVLSRIARFPEEIQVLEASYWRPRAAWVGRVAARDFSRGRRDDLWALVPRYARRSAAEEKLEAKDRQRDS
jgi:tRNA threonylcarbamoyladenosine biosynthesis protein TsaB